MPPHSSFPEQHCYPISDTPETAIRSSSFGLAFIVLPDSAPSSNSPTSAWPSKVLCGVLLLSSSCRDSSHCHTLNALLRALASRMLCLEEARPGFRCSLGGRTRLELSFRSRSWQNSRRGHHKTSRSLRTHQLTSGVGLSSSLRVQLSWTGGKAGARVLFPASPTTRCYRQKIPGFQSSDWSCSITFFFFVQAICTGGCL